jgi:transcriptional regulator with XRE-family HTH domain
MASSLGERIKEIRQSLGWTQDRLAQEAGVSKSFLSEIENNKASVSGEILLKIATALDASLDYLMKGESVSGKGKPTTIEIPPELSEVAEELGLRFKSTLALLSAHKSVLARRSTKDKSEMTKDKWRALYESLKDYLE